GSARRGARPGRPACRERPRAAGRLGRRAGGGRHRRRGGGVAGAAWAVTDGPHVARGAPAARATWGPSVDFHAKRNRTMEKLTLSDIVDIAAYERIRPELRSRTIELKKHRRVQIGPRVS